MREFLERPKFKPSKHYKILKCAKSPNYSNLPKSFETYRSDSDEQPSEILKLRAFEIIFDSRGEFHLLSVNDYLEIRSS